MDRIYLCLDLKSFYASVECVERGLDPMEADLVVADPTRTEKTICLAVTPHMKKMGVPGRCRVFEIPDRLDYIMAPPRMQLYIDYSARIYEVYLKYAAAEDIYVYSIDEVFIDATRYLGARKQTPREYAQMLMTEVYKTTGITATCGIGSNLYLAKIAMDIVAKNTPDYLASLTEESYRALLWDHLPLTDFWQISRGTSERLRRLGIQTMGEIAQADERVLYRNFGVNAALLIDRAWGRESTTLAEIHSYRPKSRSMSSGQVLPRGYDYDGAKLLVREMTELLSLDLVACGLSTGSVTLTLGHGRRSALAAEHGTITLERPTSSTRELMSCAERLYCHIAGREKLIYSIHVVFNRVEPDANAQYDLFVSPSDPERERKLQKTILQIKGKYGRNGVFRAMNLLEGARTLERNAQIGGHRA